MNTSEQQYIQLLTEEYRAFLASSFLHELSNTFGRKIGLDNEQIVLLEANLLYFALFLYSEEEFADSLVTDFNLARDEAKLLTTAELQTFPDQYAALHAIIIDALDEEDKNTSTYAPPAAAVAANLANEIAEAEAVMQTLEPIKTMRRDMETARSVSTEEPTHTAVSQAELLDRTASVKDKNPDARWSTEQT